MVVVASFCGHAIFSTGWNLDGAKTEQSCGENKNWLKLPSQTPEPNPIEDYSKVKKIKNKIKIGQRLP